MKKTHLCSLLAILFFTACSTTQTVEMSKDDQAKLLIESGASALSDGDPTAALVFLKDAQALNSESAELHYLLALTYFQKGEPALSIRSAKKALELNPKFTAAKNTLGKLYLDEGNFQKAENLLKQAANDLTYREAYLAKTNLGLLYSKKRNLKEAEHWYSKAIFDSGDNSCMASYYRGQIYFEKNELDQAKSDFIRASRKLCANFTDAHLAHGKTLVRMKKYDQARAKFIEIQKLFPQSDTSEKAQDLMKEIP